MTLFAVLRFLGQVAIERGDELHVVLEPRRCAAVLVVVDLLDQQPVGLRHKRSGMPSAIAFTTPPPTVDGRGWRARESGTTTAGAVCSHSQTLLRTLDTRGDARHPQATAASFPALMLLPQLRAYLENLVHLLH